MADKKHEAKEAAMAEYRRTHSADGYALLTTIAKQCPNCPRHLCSCGKPIHDGAHLCHSCIGTMRRNLRTLASRWDDLEAALTAPGNAPVYLTQPDKPMGDNTGNAVGINLNDAVARYIHLLPKRIADLGPAVLQIDHVTKDSDSRGRYAIGGQHKLAAVTGTAMKATIVRSGGKGEHAVVKVTVDKDKHGDVGPVGLTVAEFHLDDTQPGYTSAWLDHPTTSYDEDGHFRPTILMKRVSDYLGSTARAASMREIRQGVKGNSQSIADAVDALVREGHIRVESGARGAVLHHLITTFEEGS